MQCSVIRFHCVGIACLFTYYLNLLWLRSRVNSIYNLQTSFSYNLHGRYLDNTKINIKVVTNVKTLILCV